MSSCGNSRPITGDVATAGLFNDVGALSSGRVQLQLRGGRFCHDVQLPFYDFEIVPIGGGPRIGTLSFFPESDPAAVGTLGNVGGGLEDSARGSGLFGEAMNAVAPLAARHGLSELVVSFPNENASAIKGAENLKFRALDSYPTHVRFAMRIGEVRRNS